MAASSTLTFPLMGMISTALFLIFIPPPAPVVRSKVRCDTSAFVSCRVDPKLEKRDGFIPHHFDW